MENSVAIVTGASQWIGRSTAIPLARDFSALVLAARNAKALEEVATSMHQPSGTAQESPAHSKRCLAGGTYDLLIAQDFDRVHLSSAASRDVSCDYGDGCKQDRDAQIRDRVSRGDAEQETGHQSREDQRCNQSGHNADSC